MGEVSMESDGGVAVARLRGDYTLQSGVQCASDIIAAAVADGVGLLLIDFTAISGVTSPAPGDRHWLMTEWARLGRGAVRLALLIRPEFADPDKFGTAVGRSRGLDVKGFFDERKALDWLRAPRE